LFIITHRDEQIQIKRITYISYIFKKPTPALYFKITLLKHNHSSKTLECLCPCATLHVSVINLDHPQGYCSCCNATVRLVVFVITLPGHVAVFLFVLLSCVPSRCSSRFIHFVLLFRCVLACSQEKSFGPTLITSVLSTSRHACISPKSMFMLSLHTSLNIRQHLLLIG
jgi:hypothetical protein